MVKKQNTKTKKGWTVTFDDSTKVKTPYYPNPRMAAGYAASKHKGKIKNIHYC